MDLLLEATFFNFKYISGVERHLFLQLEILEASQLFEKIYLVVSYDIPKNFIDFNLDIELVKIPDNSIESWNYVYQNYKFSIMYSTFVPPPTLPPNQIPLIYVLHDPGRYIYPELMEKNTIDEHIELFEKHHKNDKFYVITVSEASQKDILRFFPQLKRRIFVVYNFVSKKLKQLKKNTNSQKFLYEKYFLVIGRYIPTKNTLSVIKAFEQRSTVFRDYKLVLLGRKGWYKDLEDYLNSKEVKNVITLEYVSDNEMFLLYKYCYGFISASIYEGFGLPLIEAKYCGSPRIFCSDIPVYRELDIQGAVYFIPNRVDDLVDKIFTDMLNSTISSFDYLRKFTLTSVSNQLAEVINKVI